MKATRVGLVCSLALALALAALVAGCGGGGSSSSSSTSSTTSSEEPAPSNSEESAAEPSEEASSSGAAAAVEAAEQTKGVKFPEPTEAYKPGTGKVAIISCGQAGINCKIMSEQAEKAAKAIGWTPGPIFDGALNTTKQAGFIQQAVQEGYEGIILVAVENVGSSVEIAAEHKIPVVCMDCVPTPEGEKSGELYIRTGDGTQEGGIIGEWITTQTTPTANVIMYEDPAFAVIKSRLDGETAAIEKYCPECTVTREQIPTAEIEKPGPPIFSAALSKYPPGELEVVTSGSTAYSIPMAKTAVQQGRSEIVFGTNDCGPEAIELIKEGQVDFATTAPPFPFMAWAAMDQVARAKAGVEEWNAEEIPTALVTKDNVDKFGNSYFEPEGFNFEEMFEETWEK
jgi:ABC-type sugar transport system substrate-binding protein